MFYIVKILLCAMLTAQPVAYHKLITPYQQIRRNNDVHYGAPPPPPPTPIYIWINKDHRNYGEKTDDYDGDSG